MDSVVRVDLNGDVRSSMSHSSRIDRRQFAGSLLAATSAGVLLTTSSSVATEDDNPPSEKPPQDSPTEAKHEEKTTEPAPETVPEKTYPPQEILLLTCLIQRYPSKHFDETALQGINRDLRGDLVRGRILSEFPLKNSDGPGFVFQALPIQK